MYNWSVDEETFKKKNLGEYRLWRLTQLINYGLDGEKLDKYEVIKAWTKIKDRLDPDKRKVLEFFLWGRKWKKEKGLLPDRSNFWQWYFKKRLSPSSST